MPILVKSFIAMSPKELEEDVNAFIVEIGGERVDSIQFLKSLGCGSGSPEFAAFVTYYVCC